MKTARYIAGGVLGLGLASTTLADSNRTIGWIEHVQLQSDNLQLTAKIDTGADNSSIHARDVAIYEADGVKRVRFTVENNEGKNAQFDLPLLRITQIKRKGAEPLQRPVVNMELCVGNTRKTTQVNLANRGNFTYRMLIGRSYLRNTYLVDPNVKFTAKPGCMDESLAMNEAS